MTPLSKQGRNPAQGPCSRSEVGPSSEGAGRKMVRQGRPGSPVLASGRQGPESPGWLSLQSAWTWTVARG